MDSQYIKFTHFNKSSAVKKSKQLKMTKTPYQKLKRNADKVNQKLSFNQSLNQNRSCDISRLSIASMQCKNNNPKKRNASPNSLWYFNELNRKYSKNKKEALINKLYYSKSQDSISDNYLKNHRYPDDNNNNNKQISMIRSQQYSKKLSIKKQSISKTNSTNSFSNFNIANTNSNSKLKIISFKYIAK